MPAAFVPVAFARSEAVLLLAAGRTVRDAGLALGEGSGALNEAIDTLAVAIISADAGSPADHLADVVRGDAADG